MERKAITSSTIAEAGWENEVFEVLFTSGAVYQFRPMSRAVYEEFCRSESKGKYFLGYIRPCYECTRVSEARKKEEPNASESSEENEVQTPKTAKRKKALEAARKLSKL
jgi:hypothetical protein